MGIAQKKAITVLLRQNVHLILPAGIRQPLGVCLHFGRNHAGKLVAVELQVAAFLQAAERGRNVAGKVALLQLDASGLLQRTQRGRDGTRNVGIAVQLNDAHIGKLIPEIRNLAAQLVLICHKVGQGRAIHQFGRDGSANARLGNIDALELRQLSDGCGNGTTQVHVPVNIEFGQFRQFTQIRRQGTRKVVVLEVQLRQLGKLEYRLRNSAGKFVAVHAQIRNLAQHSHFLGKYPILGDGAGSGELKSRYTTFRKRNTVPLADGLGQIPFVLGPLGALGGIVDGYQGQGVGLMGSGGQFLRNGKGGRQSLVNAGDELNRGAAAGEEDVLLHGNGDGSAAFTGSGFHLQPRGLHGRENSPADIGRNGYLECFSRAGNFLAGDIQGQLGILTLLGHGNLDGEFSTRHREFGLAGIDGLIGGHGDLHHGIAFTGYLVGGNPGCILGNGHRPGQVGSDGQVNNFTLIIGLHGYRTHHQDGFQTHLGHLHHLGEFATGHGDIGLAGVEALVGSHRQLHHGIAFGRSLVHRQPGSGGLGNGYGPLHVGGNGHIKGSTFHGGAHRLGFYGKNGLFAHLGHLDRPFHLSGHHRHLGLAGVDALILGGGNLQGTIAVCRCGRQGEPVGGHRSRPMVVTGDGDRLFSSGDLKIDGHRRHSEFHHFVLGAGEQHQGGQGGHNSQERFHISIVSN